jgi:hypothetical protein
MRVGKRARKHKKCGACRGRLRGRANGIMLLLNSSRPLALVQNEIISPISGLFLKALYDDGVNRQYGLSCLLRR